MNESIGSNYEKDMIPMRYGSSLPTFTKSKYEKLLDDHDAKNNININDNL